MSPLVLEGVETLRTMKRAEEEGKGGNRPPTGEGVSWVEPCICAMSEENLVLGGHCVYGSNIYHFKARPNIYHFKAIAKKKITRKMC